MLRTRADKLDMTLEDLLIQMCGHIADETEKVSRPPQVGDDPTRFILRDSLRESYRRESDRTGLPMRSLLYKAVQAAADYFDGRQYEATPEPVKLVPRRKAAGK